MNATSQEQLPAGRFRDPTRRGCPFKWYGSDEEAKQKPWAEHREIGHFEQRT